MSGIFDRWVRKKKPEGYAPEPTVPGLQEAPYQPQSTLSTNPQPKPLVPKGKPWWYWLLIALAALAIIPLVIVLVYRWRKGKWP